MKAHFDNPLRPLDRYMHNLLIKRLEEKDCCTQVNALEFPLAFAPRNGYFRMNIRY